MELITYKFDQFTYVDNFIILPKHTVLYRGISLGKKISKLNVLRKDTPIYLSSKEIAEAYCRGKDDLCVKIINKQELKLIDMRKIMSMLPGILNMIDKTQTNDELVEILKLTLGITTLTEQIEIVKNSNDTEKLNRMIEFSKIKRYIDTGIRMPVTNFDSYMVVLMQKTFNTLCDGIIAPRLSTVFEDSGFSHEEIIVFDTSKLAIFKNKDIPIVSKSINELIDQTKKYKLYNSEFIIHGGTDDQFVDKNEQFNKIDQKTLKTINSLGNEMNSILTENRYYNLEKIIKNMKEKITRNEPIFTSN